MGSFRMIKKILLATAMILASTTVWAGTAWNEANPADIINDLGGSVVIDMFREMGGVSAMAKECYSSNTIGEHLIPILARVKKENNGDVSFAINQLMSVYNASIDDWKKDKKVWTGGDYGTANCADQTAIDKNKELEEKFAGGIDVVKGRVDDGFDSMTSIVK